MKVRLLGPIQVEGDGAELLATGGPKERALLAVLAVRANQAVPEDVLADALWGDELPQTPGRALQVVVSRVRRSLGSAGGALESHRGSWLLRLAEPELDVAVVDGLVRRGREANAQGDHVGAALAYADALREFRGRPLEEFADAPWATVEIARLEELRQFIVEERVEAELACGRHAELAGELEAICRLHPLRERVWGQRMIALYRSGRQADALRAFQELRRTLRDELGIAPSPALVRLEQAILSQSASLELVPNPPIQAVPRVAPEPSVAPAVPTGGVVTFLFTDIVGSTELLSRLGDAAFDAIRRDHFTLLHETVVGAGGSAVKNLGDGVMAVFASALDALGCATAIQQAVARRNRRSRAEAFGVRVGLSIGEPIEDDDDYYGLAVVVAKRLCDWADPGRIVTSRLVADLVAARGSFEFEDLGELELKGIQAPVPACAVVWRESGARPFPPAMQTHVAGTFVGRETELGELADGWRRAQAGAVEVMMLAGEPGIGKTTLAARLAAMAWNEGGVALFGRCDEESVAPFQPFVEALAHYVTTTPPATLRAQLGAQAADLALLVPEVGRVLPEVMGVVPTGAETERYRVFEAVPALVRSISAEAPVLLVLDDLHWADRPTLQLLQHVIRRAAPAALFVVGTYRDTDLVRTHPMAEALADMRRANLVQRVPVKGLTELDVLALVTGGGNEAAGDAAFANALWSETEGSPLFLREILRHLDEAGMVERDDNGRWRALRRIDQLGIPEGVREVIGRRLARLGDDANAVLRTGAVLGREVRIDLVAAVTDLGTDRIVTALDEATSAGVVEEVAGKPGRYAFTHALVRQSLYDELSLTRRVLLHQRVGEALEAMHSDADGAHLAELAHHFAQCAVAGQAAKAIDYTRRAAAHARASIAYEDAARLYASAIEIADDMGIAADDRADLLQARAECLWLAGHYEAARTVFESVIEATADDAERNARAALGYAGAGVRPFWFSAFRLNEPAIAHLERALDRLPTADSALRARVAVHLAMELYFSNESVKRRVALASEAVAVARRIGDPATLAHVLATATFASFSRYNVHERIADATEARAIADEIGDTQLGAYAAFHLAIAQAVAAQERAVLVEAWRDAADRFEKIRDPMWQWMAPGQAAGLATLEGRFDDAEAMIRDSFMAGQEARDPSSFILVGGGAFILRTFQGRITEMMSLAHEAPKLFPYLTEFAHCLYAMTYADVGAFDLARAELLDPETGTPFELADDAVFGFAAYALGRAYWRLGDADGARWLLDRALPLAATNTFTGYGGWGSMHFPLALACATCERWDDAESHFEAALAVHREFGWVACVVDTQVAYAAVLARRRGQGDADRALALLDEATAAAERLGMTAHLRESASIRDGVLGVEQSDRTARRRRAITRRDRLRARLTLRGRAMVRRWTAAHDDETLVRRFGQERMQQALITAMVRSFQPGMAVGVAGELEFELLPPDAELNARGADWWTIDIADQRATARCGRATAPILTMHIGLADFVRLGGGELSAARAILDGRMHIDGDPMLGLRIADLFGAVEPVEEVARARERAV